MYKTSGFLIFFSLVCVAAKAQIGETKESIIKMYDMCKIIYNEPESLVVDCNGRTAYTFDNNSICITMYYEIEKSEWYRNQVNLLLKYGGKYDGLVKMPLPSFPDKKETALHYFTLDSDFYYFDCSGMGYKDSDYRAVLIKKR